ncbi:MAG: Ni/Fe-hydrogenase, b-type cytochrome subunit [Propionibacteriales bacterium]|nr:Ni/Fe-hydrogenase, b-type cytochrome subunit [Propionibacteriales bacterium]
MTVDEQAAPAAEKAALKLTAGSIFTAGKMNVGRVLAMAAAAAPAGSTDPVDVVLADRLVTERDDILTPTVADGDVDPARMDRRYSLTRVRDLQLPGGKGTGDFVVMRGDLAAVLTQCKISREDRAVAVKNADLSSRRGFRPLAVASAPVGDGDVVGDFTFQGYIELRSTAPAGFADDVAASPDSWARVNLWSASLRLQHWSNVLAIVVLSLTGYLIMDPFFGPSATDQAQQAGYLMGWVRVIHFTTAFIWLVIGAARVVSAFRSRDRYLRWPTLWPLKKKDDVKNLGEVVGHYLFIRKHAPLYLAHNPLQQLGYTGMYVLGAIQMVTGLTLYGMVHKNSSWFWGLVSTPVDWFGITNVRVFHAVIMFLIWAFVILHIYLAVRSDSLERHGGISSMINGGVWMRRGAKPVDSPKIG